MDVRLEDLDIQSVKEILREVRREARDQTIDALTDIVYRHNAHQMAADLEQGLLREAEGEVAQLRGELRETKAEIRAAERALEERQWALSGVESGAGPKQRLEAVRKVQEKETELADLRVDREMIEERLEVATRRAEDVEELVTALRSVPKPESENLSLIAANLEEMDEL